MTSVIEQGTRLPSSCKRELSKEPRSKIRPAEDAVSVTGAFKCVLNVRLRKVKVNKMLHSIHCTEQNSVKTESVTSDVVIKTSGAVSRRLASAIPSPT